jgi:hypothetical protein
VSKRKIGRPSSFSPQIAETICTRLIGGESLRTICEDDGIPEARTVHRWLASEDEQFTAFRQQYARAREAQAETLFDEILEIVDDGRNDWVERERKDGTKFVALNDEAIARSRLRMDARRWMAGKLAPKKYGEKVVNEHSGPDGGPVESKVTVEFVRSPS